MDVYKVTAQSIEMAVTMAVMRSTDLFNLARTPAWRDGSQALNECIKRMATKTWNNSLSLASVKTSQDMTARTSAESLVRLEAKVDGTINRREHDTRLVAVESRLVELGVRLREVDVLVMRLQASGQRQP